MRKPSSCDYIYIYIYIYIHRVLQKKRNPISKSCISKTNKAIIISQTSLYLSTFCSLLVEYSNEIDQQCRSRGFLKNVVNYLLEIDLTNGILYFSLPNCLFFSKSYCLMQKNGLDMDSPTFHRIVKHEIIFYPYKMHLRHELFPNN